ncbi:MarR family winged helix-turn-helix transcriptional regulator [Aliivibrio kagoshimensis]|uniref:MarR family winged helix-turn-helix transcriptional regulator n=1 Tax=Aliivibrio kagoshimensis TaxID=2910230 RepID=UPI003D0FACC2
MAINNRDSVDHILAQWAAARPELDSSTMGVVARLRRTSNIWTSKLEVVFKEHGMSIVEFDILATLRRTNAAVTPTELYHALMLSSGAVSTRIEQLVKRGFVQRVASEEDRRSCKVTLTEKGIELIDTAVNEHVANMDNMLTVLSHKEQQQLSLLLKKVLLSEHEE